MRTTLERGQIKPSQPPRRVAGGARIGRHNGATSTCHSQAHERSATGVYPAARHPGLPSVPPTFRGVPRLRNEGDRCASPPAQIRQVRAGASLRGVNVGSSRMPVRHARHTRVVWQYRHAAALSGPLATRPGASRDRLPPASPPRCDGTEAKGLSPPPNQQAPHGAPAE